MFPFAKVPFWVPIFDPQPYVIQEMAAGVPVNHDRSFLTTNLWLCISHYIIRNNPWVAVLVAYDSFCVNHKCEAMHTK